MAASRADLFAELSRLGIETETVDHDPVFTVAQSEMLHAEIPGGHTKNLFLKDAKGRLFLLIAESHASVDMKRLHKKLGCARLSFGKPDLLMEKLGVEPGSVTAFTAINDPAGDVGFFIDKDLLSFDRINCHPLTNAATTIITTDDLMTFLRHTGHEPTPIDLAAEPPEVS